MENLHSNDKKDNLILERAAQYAVSSAGDVDDAWHKMKMRIDENAKVIPIGNRKHKVLRMIAAAAVLILFVSFISLQFSNVEYAAKPGQIASITLPDNSSVRLNSTSVISYNTLLWHFNRKVEMKGEAFFNVKKGSTFLVETDFGDVEVLGTSFNVNTFNQDLNVFCKTGRVKISTDIESIEIVEGDFCIIHNGEIQAFPIENPDIYTSWIEGKFQFSERPIKEVLQTIERQYDVEVRSDFIGNELFSGTFDNKNLTSALELICTPYGKNFVIKEHRIVEIE